MARQTNFSAYFNIKLLQCGLMVVIETVATVFMRALKFSHAGVFYISKNARGDFASRVTVSLSFPILEAHTFLFKFAYSLRKRRLDILRSHNFRLGVNDGAVELDNCFLQLCRISNIYKAFPDLKREAKRRKCLR